MERVLLESVKGGVSVQSVFYTFSVQILPYTPCGRVFVWISLICFYIRWKDSGVG